MTTVLWLATAVFSSATAQTSAPVPSEPLVFQAALQTVEPAIVRIETLGGAQPVRRQADPTGEQRAAPTFRQADGPTTGVVWSTDGTILTSSFNFAREPSVITVALADGRRFVAQLIARDYVARLALLHVDAADLPIAEWRTRDTIRPGQWALAAGHGQDSGTPAVSVGIVSAVSRMSGLAIQTDAKISPANYGGPLFDIDGKVMGICVPIGQSEEQDAGVDWYDSGIGFAVPYDVLVERVERLRTGSDIRRGYLGLVLDTNDAVVATEPSADAESTTTVPATSQPTTTLAPPPPGLRILAEPRGPAAGAGLAEGDIITAIDGHPTPTALDMRRVLARRAAGDKVRVEVWRAGNVNAVILQLAAAADFGPQATSRPQ